MQQLLQVFTAPLARSRGAQFGNRWSTLLKRDLRFVQRRHTYNLVKEREPIGVWTNEIVQHQPADE